MNDIIIISCPHCQNFIEVRLKYINCAIFRHGVFKDTGRQIEPHAPKHVCDNLVEKNLIYGCGKPFKLWYNKHQQRFFTTKCDYI